MAEQSPPPSSASASSSSQPPPNGPRKSRFSSFTQRMGRAGRGLRIGVNIFVLGSLAIITYGSYIKQVRYLTIRDGTTITWRLEQLGISETTLDSGNLFSTLSCGTIPQISFLDALKTIRWMRDDDRITGLIMDFSSTGAVSRAPLGLGQMQELRDAILQLGEAKKERLGQGKFNLHAITDTFDSQMHYYLASAFDKISMEPVGQIPLPGIASVNLFFKNMLDKIGVKFRGYSVGEYKSVQTPFTETQFPTPIRENTVALLASINDQIIDGIARTRRALLSKFGGFTSSDLESNKNESRSHIDDSISVTSPESKNAEVLITPPSSPATSHNNTAPSHGSTPISVTSSSTEIDKVKHIMDLAPLSAEEAKTAGLITSIAHKREFYDLFWPVSSPYSRAVRRPDTLPGMTFQRYAAAISNEKAKQNKAGVFNNIVGLAKPPPDGIAVRPVLGLVYVIGMIVRGNSQFGSNTIVKAITDAARDTDVKAIVLRIDSNGGDPIASETIWEAVEKAQTLYNKPVIASFANIAASGGYYIAAPTTKILCNPGTITGSIGVAAFRPVVLPDLLSKFGISVEQIAFTESGKAYTIFEDLKGLSLNRFTKHVDEIYEIFRLRVANGRGMKTEDVEKVARGRVWSGIDALKVGLVDELGGIERAIQVATKYGYPTITPGGFINPEPEIRIYPLPTNLFERFLGANTMEEAVAVTKQELYNLSRSFVRALFRDEIKQMVVEELGIEWAGDGVKLQMEMDFSLE